MDNTDNNPLSVLSDRMDHWTWTLILISFFLIYCCCMWLNFPLILHLTVVSHPVVLTPITIHLLLVHPPPLFLKAISRDKCLAALSFTSSRVIEFSSLGFILHIPPPLSFLYKLCPPTANGMLITQNSIFFWQSFSWDISGTKQPSILFQHFKWMYLVSPSITYTPTLRKICYKHLMILFLF